MYRQITNYEGQNTDNLIKVLDSTKGCCGDAPAVCQYDVTIPTANAVNNIIFKNADGTNVTRTFSPAVTGAANVIAAIKAAITPADGYEGDDDAVREVTSTTSGSNTIYHITGEVVVVSMLHNTSTTVNAATPKCTRINTCEFYLEYAGGDGDAFVVNGVSDALGDLTFATTDAADVITALEAASNWPTTATVDVVKNETDDVFEITISDLGTQSFTLAGDAFLRSNCAPGYIV